MNELEYMLMKLAEECAEVTQILRDGDFPTLAKGGIVK